MLSQGSAGKLTRDILKIRASNGIFIILEYGILQALLDPTLWYVINSEIKT